MPTGTPHDSFALPYRIRVDDFATPSSWEFGAPPLLHLLTHTHSDHLNGLSAKSFGYKVYCSQDAKEMLLRHEVYAERDLQARNLRAEKIRTFSHLKVTPQISSDGPLYPVGSKDLLHTLPLHTPTEVELNASEKVTITLFDANHCPGAVMYLIEGSRGAVLHTGDFRAEPWFLDSIMRNPLLQPYLSTGGNEDIITTSRSGITPLTKTLEAIYIDTACVLSPLVIPTKSAATQGLIQLMKLLPPTTYFFLNTWTWGYEDVLKEIAREFQTQIHVDSYKYSIYQRVSDPFLRAITTQDSSVTRFHACERFDRCPYVAVDELPNSSTYANCTSRMGKHVVYVNPVTMRVEAWQNYIKDRKVALDRGEQIKHLLVPLSRHSTLPELQAFVKLFRPHRVVPNTLDPRLLQLDWLCIKRMFAPCLHPTSRFTTSSDLPSLLHSFQGLTLEEQDDGDVALKNLVGEGAAGMAQRWVDDGKLTRTIEFIKTYLKQDELNLIGGLLNLSKPPHTSNTSRTMLKQSPIQGSPPKEPPAVSRNHVTDSDEESTDNEEENYRTAVKIFGVDSNDKENDWVVPSQSSQGSEDSSRDILSTNLLTPISQKGELTHISDASGRLNRLTPAPSFSLLPPSSNSSTSGFHKEGPINTSAQKASVFSTSGSFKPDPQTPLRSSALAKTAPRAKESKSTPSIAAVSLSNDIASDYHVEKRDGDHRLSATRSLFANKGAASSSNAPGDCHFPSYTASIFSRTIPRMSSNAPHHKSIPSPSTSTPPSIGDLGPRKRMASDELVDLPSAKKTRIDIPPPLATREQPPVVSNPPTMIPTESETLARKSLRQLEEAFVKHRKRPSWLPSGEHDDLAEYRQDPNLSKDEKSLMMRLDHTLGQWKRHPEKRPPTYTAKRQQLLDRLAGFKRRRQAGNEIILGTPSTRMSTSEPSTLAFQVRPSEPKAKLGSSQHVPSFKPVDDECESQVDWNRSRELAEALRQDIAAGRRLRLPPLKCAESQTDGVESL